MEMLKVTNYSLSQISYFAGTCANCHVPLFYSDSIPVVVMREEWDRWIVAPVDLYSCPECKSVIATIDVYKEDSVLMPS